MAMARTIERLQPIPVRAGNGALGRASFAIRRAVDLQLHTICLFLKHNLSEMNGDVLDVGCGEMPFRSMLPSAAKYTGVDVPNAAIFGMGKHPEKRTFDGRTLPFPPASFDYVICTEVLEHAQFPQLLLDEMRRVLRPGGRIFVTVPFSARVHHIPHDYQRFTHIMLAAMFADFRGVRITERGNDLAVIANKLIVVAMRLAQPSWHSVWRLPALLALAPVGMVFLILAHLSLRFGFGSRDDPLGYAISAQR